MAEKKTKKEFSLKLSLGDSILESSGDSMFEALSTLPVPAKIVSKGILEIRHNERTRTILYTIPRLKRVFYPNKLARIMQSKILSIGLE